MRVKVTPNTLSQPRAKRLVPLRPRSGAAQERTPTDMASSSHLCLVLCALVALGAAQADGRAPRTSRQVPDGDGPFLVGAGIADATGPAADVNFMGYAMPSQTARGIHFRQRARAFVIADAANPDQRSASTDSPTADACAGLRAFRCSHFGPPLRVAVAFVSLDSGMASQPLKAGVVAKLQTHFGGLYNHTNVCISGTHTHSTPAGFLQYVLFQVTSLGAVPEALDAFVNGVVNAIVRAHNAAKPATIAVAQGLVENANINRSPTAYANNPAEERARYANNTDHEMVLLRFDGADGTEIGMLNWYAVHGTSMNNTNRLISGDNKGVASMLFEAEKNPPGTLPGTGSFVGAFAQTNLGDVSPNTRGPHCLDTGLPCDNPTSTCNGKNELCAAQGPGRDMFESTLIIGQLQHDVAMALYESASTKLTSGVDWRHQFVDMPSYTVLNASGTSGGNATLCKPAMGYSFAAGTTDGPGAFNFKQGTTTSNPFWNSLSHLIATPTQADKDCQHPKPILLATGETSKPYDWDPAIVDTQIFRVGQLFILAVPAEFTTMSGRRIRESVKAQLIAEGAATEDAIVVIAGLANTYSSYVTVRAANGEPRCRARLPSDTASGRRRTRSTRFSAMRVRATSSARTRWRRTSSSSASSLLLWPRARRSRPARPLRTCHPSRSACCRQWWQTPRRQARRSATASRSPPTATRRATPRWPRSCPRARGTLRSRPPRLVCACCVRARSHAWSFQQQPHDRGLLLDGRAPEHGRHVGGRCSRREAPRRVRARCSAYRSHRHPRLLCRQGNWETQFHWYRHSGISSQSFADITWAIPEGTAAGSYRIGHRGYYKHFLGHTVAFQGYSSTFSVTA